MLAFRVHQRLKPEITKKAMVPLRKEVALALYSNTCTLRPIRISQSKSNELSIIYQPAQLLLH